MPSVPLSRVIAERSCCKLFLQFYSFIVNSDILLFFLKEEQTYITRFLPGIINEKQINFRTIKWRHTSAPRGWSHKEPFTNIFGNLSSAANNTPCRLPFRISFYVLWLCQNSSKNQSITALPSFLLNLLKCVIMKKPKET